MTLGNNTASAAHLWVVSAPSGTGKTSLVKRLLADLPDICLSVSYTTRAPRVKEVEGQHYHFVDVPVFLRMRQEQVFLESAEVFGNYYGTSQVWVEEQLAQGHDVLLEIDWQGAQSIQARMPQARSIFIFPPSLAALSARLEKRGQDSPEVIQKRLEQAQWEMQHYTMYDYLVVNADFETALAHMRCIIQAARLERERQAGVHAGLIQQLMGT